MPLFRQAIVNIAASQLGCAEDPRGSNWGKHIKKYLGSVGISFPAAWCMAFVYWCVDEACRQQGLKNPLYKTGGVMEQWNHTLLSTRSLVPQAGDVFIMDFGKGLGHTGIVEKVEGIWIYTIEGNTNDDGSREGYEVARRRRELKKIKGYIILKPQAINS